MRILVAVVLLAGCQFDQIAIGPAQLRVADGEIEFRVCEDMTLSTVTAEIKSGSWEPFWVGSGSAPLAQGDILSRETLSQMLLDLEKLDNPALKDGDSVSILLESDDGRSHLAVFHVDPRALAGDWQTADGGGENPCAALVD